METDDGVNTYIVSGVSAACQKTSSTTVPEICVICLDRVSEQATALPCGHDQFDFPCIGTWLQQQQYCPLCKARVHAVRYADARTATNNTFHLPSATLPRQSQAEIRRRRHQYQQRRLSSSETSRADAFRSYVYRNRLYSLRFGTNKFSGYHNFMPDSFLQDEQMTSRARFWIRRELRVFEFLRPASSSFGRPDRRATNPEFLLEYIIAILKAIDIRGSSGQAQELLKDYLGRENANLFLHELESWLRSPFARLEEWDTSVQYPKDDKSLPAHQASFVKNHNATTSTLDQGLWTQ